MTAKTNAERCAKSYWASPVRRRAMSRRWYRKNKVWYRAAQRKRYKTDPTYRKLRLDTAKRGAYKYRYGGFTLENKATLLRKQKGKCAICKRRKPDTKKGWHTDHNHKTGHVRGILCQRCNHRLGVVEDKKFLRAALKYLLPSR